MDKIIDPLSYGHVEPLEQKQCPNFREQRYKSLSDLLIAFANFWASQQATVPHYKRCYDTDGQTFIRLWEGNPGSLDRYGDFTDDDYYYNHCERGLATTISFTKNLGFLSFGVSYTVDFGNRFFAKLSLNELKHILYAELTKISLKLSPEQKALVQFIAKYRDKVAEFLFTQGEQSIYENRISHTHLNRVSMSFWDGKEEAVWFPKGYMQFTNGYIYDGRPMLRQQDISHFVELSVIFLLAPRRFRIETRIMKNNERLFDPRYKQLKPDFQDWDKVQNFISLELTKLLDISK